MATLSPFRALRPPPAIAARVASPPYDVVTTTEARALAAREPDSFLRVSRPEIDLPEGTDEHADAVYEQGRTNLAELVRRGRPRAGPGAAPLRLRAEDGRAPPDRPRRLRLGRRVRPRRHQEAREDARRQGGRPRPPHRHARRPRRAGVPHLPRRRRHRRRRRGREARRRRPTTSSPPDGVGHQLWVVARRGGPRGSRRSSGRCRRSTSPTATTAPPPPPGSTRGAAGSPASTARFLAVVFPHDQMQILAYNRLVRDPKGRTPDALLAALRGGRGPRARDLGPRPTRRSPSASSSAAAGGARASGPAPSTRRDPVASLDCSIVQDAAPRAALRHRRPAHREGRRLRRRHPRAGGARAAGEARRAGRSRSTSSRPASSSSSRSPTPGSSCRRRAPGSSRSCAPGCSCTRSSALSPRARA